MNLRESTKRHDDRCSPSSSTSTTKKSKNQCNRISAISKISKTCQNRKNLSQLECKTRNFKCFRTKCIIRSHLIFVYILITILCGYQLNSVNCLAASYQHDHNPKNGLEQQKHQNNSITANALDNNELSNVYNLSAFDDDLDLLADIADNTSYSSLFYNILNKNSRVHKVPVYLNEFAVYIPAGQHIAERIATKYGFTNVGQIFAKWC